MLHFLVRDLAGVKRCNSAEPPQGGAAGSIGTYYRFFKEVYLIIVCPVLTMF